MEDYAVKGAKLDEEIGRWTLFSKANDKPKYKAKILVAADGSVSYLAKQLGNINKTFNAVCSSVYIKANTYDYKGDGIVFYPRELLPGYAAIFREGDGDLVFCCYIIPGGKCKSSDLKQMHYKLLYNYEPLTSRLGPSAEIENMKAAPIRFGGINKSYGKRLLIVGDAAGQIDPLTGEGIQYAMDAGKIAAQTLHQAFEQEDFSEKQMMKYQTRWMDSFGKDFKYSSLMTKILAKHPIFLDAFAGASARKGAQFMTEWAKIMTGSKPKSHFFKPKLAFPLLWEIIRQKILKMKPN